ncbi:uncharacterized protein LOC117585913 [Drosophila guanche]|uniref:CHK kinase-like domain-containing protein n=1 Tax=Drosophila guanche TaxID=7266 RepID=A0A3B0KF22_DROGU|nr:uncharacterized protein LOC117585913 [Drosophila guanche]SPP84316.1 Hypothetical predicted protein [Drosophila guanche]
MSKIENPNENLVIPKWLNEDKFKTVLAKDVPHYSRILEFTPVAAIPPGSNFTSILVRVHLHLELKDGSLKTQSYVVKTTLEFDKGGRLVEEFRYFQKEQQMYATYLPAFEQLYLEAGHSIQLAPKCLEVGEMNGYLYFIFEDLSSQEFETVDRSKGLDMPHISMSLRKLAELHAASVVYENRHGSYPIDFEHGFAHKDNTEHSKRGFLAKVTEYTAAMKTWGIEERYLKNFPTPEQYVQMCLESLRTDANDFNVLTHGDFWSSNILFRYNSNDGLDRALLLDFQHCKWGSPGQDLLFVITISAGKDLRLREYENFVRIYWEHLIDCLGILSYKKSLPQLRDLQAALYKKNNSFYAFFPLMSHLSAVLLPSDRNTNLHTLMSQDEAGRSFRTRLYTNPAFVEIIKEVYPFYCNRGLFNFSDYE